MALLVTLPAEILKEIVFHLMDRTVPIGELHQTVESVVVSVYVVNRNPWFPAAAGWSSVGGAKEFKKTGKRIFTIWRRLFLSLLRLQNTCKALRAALMRGDVWQPCFAILTKFMACAIDQHTLAAARLFYPGFGDMTGWVFIERLHPEFAPRLYQLLTLCLLHVPKRSVDGTYFNSSSTTTTRVLEHGFDYMGCTSHSTISAKKEMMIQQWHEWMNEVTRLAKKRAREMEEENLVAKFPRYR